MLPYQYIYTENGTNGNGKFPFVFCRWKTKVCLPWSANGKRKSTFAVPANVSAVPLCLQFKHR